MITRNTMASALIAATLFLASSAPAATLFTPPLSFQTWFGTEIVCKITNVADTESKVRVRSIRQNGRTDDDSGAVVLRPHQTIEAASSGSGRSYCRFDVQGDADRVRASACTVDVPGQRCVGIVEAY